MPGPPKNNPLNTTGLRIPKAGGKKSRTPPVLPAQTPRTSNPELDKYIADLREQVEKLNQQIQLHEQKLNRMQVDPVTHVVTFIA